MIARFLADYGMLLVLAALCALLSVATISEQHPSGVAAAEQLAGEILKQTSPGSNIAIIARDGHDDQAFSAALEEILQAADRVVVVRVNGQPRDGTQALAKLARDDVKIDAIAVTKEVEDWAIFTDFDRKYPRSAGAKLLRPASYYWPDFLKSSNLLNIADQIAVIAIMAIGMTMVIITGGIDLSVGSLLALSTVFATLMIREFAGAREATALGMTVCCALAIAVCGCIGLATGLVVTEFRVPAFIVTLGVMLMARGGAGKLTGGQTVYEVPDSFVWLGRESTFGFLPNAVFVMLVLYVLAHLLMSQTVLGRYIYAVGGNREAARLSGVPVQLVTICVYVVAGALAGLGGVITASKLKTGGPNYGALYELYVIAAVVVGGTSLNGGEGKIFGTLIGAFLIAVIQNGMNLLGLQSFDQEIVLGAVIILAVLFDSSKHVDWLLRQTFGRLAWLLGVALLVLVVNVSFSILYMVVYSYLIDPGHDVQYYEDHIQVAAPYCGIVAGIPLMFLAGWWVGGWWQGEIAIKAALVVWLTYALIDIAVLLAAGMTTRIAILFAVSFLSKLAAVYFGALLGDRRAESGAATDVSGM